MHRWGKIVLVVGISMAVAGCPKDRTDFNQGRFDAGELHIKNGLKLRERGDLEGAATEFQKATSTDASSVVAEEELRKTIGTIDTAKRASNAVSEAPVD